MNTNPLQTLRSIVYCIRNKINGFRYIGKTKHTFFTRYPGGAWWDYTENKLLLSDYAKFGKDAFEVEILDAGYSEFEILELESMYIFSYNSFVPNGYNLFYDTDPLNDTGNGKIYVAKLKEDKIYVFQKDYSDNNLSFYLNNSCGTPCAEETKKKISIANKGSKRTPEQCERIGASKRGKKQTPESIAKRSASLKGKHTIPVLQIDPETNQVIAEYKSIQDATISLGLKTSSNLTSVCKGRQKTAGGYIFRYKHEITS